MILNVVESYNSLPDEFDVVILEENDNIPFDEITFNNYVATQLQDDLQKLRTIK